MSFVRSENLHRSERFVGLHHSESDGYFGQRSNVYVLSGSRREDQLLLLHFE
jgi:hypothetical protein